MRKMPSSGFLDKITLRIFKSMWDDREMIFFEDYVKFMDLLVNGNLENRSKLTFSLIAQEKSYFND